MTKGCCKKTTIEKPPKVPITEEPPKPIEDSEANTKRSENDDKFLSRADKLLEYQQIIEESPQNMSLTKLVLTKQLAIEFANTRGKNGEGLGQCVFPNVFNLNCLIPYAVTPDCYSDFADFFGDIIEQIHGPLSGVEYACPYFGDINEKLLIDLNSFSRKRQRVIYSDMVIRRNVHDFPFTPFLKSNDRKRIISLIEPKLREIFESLVELSMIPREWEERFDKIANELDDCGSMRDFPDDRLMLVFKDEEKFYQGCILNVDDHIQYTVSGNNGKVGELLSKMKNLINNAKLNEIKYSTHSVFGNLTLSPAYVGTGYSIRTLAKFPFISRLGNANTLIKPFNCTIHNEVSNQNTGMVFLCTYRSMKREEDIFLDFLLAFNKLSYLEDELECTTPMSIQYGVSSVENLNNLLSQIQASSSKSYTKIYLTEDLVKQYETVRTRFGTLINNCIRHNAYHPNSLFPRACDKDCYIVFQSFFNPILLQTNNIKSFKHPKNPTYGSTKDKLYKLHHPHIYSYRVRFLRNLEGFPFPIMMSKLDRIEVENLMNKIFDEIPVEFEGVYIKLKSLKNSIYLEEILKYKLIPSFSEIDASSGLCNNWPHHRGVYFTKQNINYPNIVLAILINFTDHIKVVSLDPSGENLNLCFERAVNLMKFLDLRLEKQYAFRFNYGYLTTVPNSVGCALRISVLIKLESLGNRREILENQCKALQFAYRGSFGQGTVAYNNVFDISLKVNINVTERWVVMIFVQRLKDLMNTERQFNPRIEKPSCEEKQDYEDDFEDDYDDESNDDKVIAESQNVSDENIVSDEYEKDDEKDIKEKSL